jgi:hypothetical protein
MTKALEPRPALAKCRNHQLQVVRFKVAENVCEGVTTGGVASGSTVLVARLSSDASLSRVGKRGPERPVPPPLFRPYVLVPTAIQANLYAIEPIILLHLWYGISAPYLKIQTLLDPRLKHAFRAPGVVLVYPDCVKGEFNGPLSAVVANL